MIFKNGPCPNGWKPFEVTKKCYNFIMTPMRYLDADNYCRVQGPNGHLVSIHSRFENTYIAGIFPSLYAMRNSVFTRHTNLVMQR